MLTPSYIPFVKADPNFSSIEEALVTSPLAAPAPNAPLTPPTIPPTAPPIAVPTIGTTDPIAAPAKAPAAAPAIPPPVAATPEINVSAAPIPSALCSSIPTSLATITVPTTAAPVPLPIALLIILSPETSTAIAPISTAKAVDCIAESAPPAAIPSIVLSQFCTIPHVPIAAAKPRPPQSITTSDVAPSIGQDSILVSSISHASILFIAISPSTALE